MIIPIGYGQATFAFSGTALPNGGVVTLGFFHVGSGHNAADAAAILAGHWIDEILPRQTQEVTLDSVLVKFGPNELGTAAEFSVGDPGGVSSGPATPNVSYLVQKQTALGGRKNRGRMFIPGVGEDAVNGAGVLETTFFGQLAGDVEDFRADCDADGLPLHVLHSDVADDPTEITALILSNRVATQRRRLRR